MTDRRSFLLAAILLVIFGVVASGQTQTVNDAAPASGNAAQLNQLLERVRERIQKYHEALFNITVTEVVIQQELRADSTPKGKPRSMVYESVTLHRNSPTGQQDAVPIITRTLKSIDGKPAKHPLRPRSKCVDTNPAPAYGDPLAFLLADNPIRFIYAYAGEADLEERKTAVVSITTPPATEPVALVEKDNCFRLSRALQRKAIIWIDLETFDVLKLQWQLAESFTGKMSAGVTRVGILPVFRPRREITYDKWEFVIRFRPIIFENPSQTLLLPVSSESIWILKGTGIAGYRTNTEYTRYRRYITSVQVKDSDGKD